MAITFHDILAEAKIASELITSIQSLHVQQTFHVRFPVLVNHAKWNIFVTDVESQ